MKFCFICGKESEKLFEGLCEQCYSKKNALIEIPKDLYMMFCVKCLRIKNVNKWTEMEITEFLKTKIKIIGKIKKLEIIEKKGKYEVSVEGCPGQSKIIKKESHELTPNIRKVTCPSCSRKSGSYYEATLQIRGEKIDELIDFIDTELIKIKKKNDMAFFWYEQVKGGVDIFVGNAGAANEAADLAKKKLKAEIKKSYRQMTQINGKEVYRTTISIRI